MLVGEGLRCFEVVVGVCLVFEWAGGEARELSVVAVVENGEVLAVGGEVGCETRAGEGVGDGIGGEGRGALFAVGDERLAGRRHAGE